MTLNVNAKTVIFDFSDILFEAHHFSNKESKFN